MNKIYRTVYNESTNTWVAVEETAKSHRKSSGGVVDNATTDVSGNLKSMDFKKSAIIVAIFSLFTPLSVWAANPQGLMFNGSSLAGTSNKNYEAQIENNPGAYNTVKDTNQTVWGERNSVTGEHASVLGGISNLAGKVQYNGKDITKVEYDKDSQIYTLTLSDGTKATRTLSQFQTLIGNATSSGQGQVVLGGESNVASGNNAVAWGLGNTASGANSTAFGSGSTASSSNATAWGSGYAGAVQSTDTVNYTISSGNYPADENGNRPTFTITKTVTGNGVNATAWGGGRAIGSYSTAMARGKAYGDSSLAVGNGAIAYGSNSIAFGRGKAIGSDSIAFGRATAEGPNSFANGSSKTIARGSNSVAYGESTIAEGNNAMTWGFGTRTAGNNATAFGKNTVASGERATAFGMLTTANGQNATAWGNNSIANGGNSTAWGQGTIAGRETTLPLTFAYGGTVYENMSIVEYDDTTSLANDKKQYYIKGTTYDANGNPIEQILVGRTGDANALMVDNSFKGVNLDGAKEKLKAWVENNRIKVNATAFGLNNQALANNSVTAGGFNNVINAGSENSASLGGENAQIQGKDSVTLGGNGSQALADNSLAALGGVVNSGADNAIAMGGTVSGENGVAIGKGSSAFQNAVALGSGSTTATGVQVESAGKIGDATYTNHTWSNKLADANKVVSVGNRQIQHVANGQVLPTSTDAINGSQLYAAYEDLQWKAGVSSAGGKVSGVPVSNQVIGDYSSSLNSGVVNFKAGEGIEIKTTNSNSLDMTFKVHKEEDGHTATNGKIGGGTADQYWDSVQVANAINDSGWKLGNSSEIINPGDTVNFNGQNGITVNATDGNVTIGFDKEIPNYEAGNNISFQNVTDNEGNITSTKINARDTTIQAASGNQHLTVSGGTLNDAGVREYTIQSNLKGDNKNISVANDGTISFTDTTTYTSEVNGLGLAKTGDEVKLTGVLPTSKVVAGTNITSVSSATDTATGVTTYTVNAKGVQAASGNQYVTVADNGTNFVINEGSLANDIKAAKSEVVAGKGGVSVSSATNTNGANVYTVNAIDTQITSGNGHISIATAEPDDNGVRNYVVQSNLKGDGENISVANDGTISFTDTHSWIASDGKNRTSVNKDKEVVWQGSGSLKVENENGTFTISDKTTYTSEVNGLGLSKDGDTVKLTGTLPKDTNTVTAVTTTDSNLKVKPTINDNEREYDIALNKNLDLSDSGSLKTGNTLINNDGVTAKNITGDTVNATTLNAGDGNVFNVSGSTATYNTTVSGDNGKEVANVEYVNKVQTVVEQGKNTVVTGNKNSNGGMTYTVDAYDTKVKAGSGLKLTQNGDTADSNNVRTYELALSDENQNAINNAMSSLTTAVDGTTAQTLNNSSNQANFMTGDNIQLSGDANGITIATKKDVQFDSVETGSLKADTANISTGNISTLNAGNHFTVAGDTATYNTTVSGNDGKEVANVAYVQKALPTVKAGTNIVSVAETSEDGHKVYTVNAKGVQAASGNQYVTVADNGTNFVINEGSLANDIKAAKSEVVAGKGGVSVSSATNTNGANVYTVNAIDTQITSGNGHISIAATEPDDNGVRNYVVQSNLKGDGENISVANDGTISFTDTHSWIASDGTNRTTVNKDKEVVWQGSGSLKVENSDGTFTVSDKTTYQSEVTGLGLAKTGDEVKLTGVLPTSVVQAGTNITSVSSATDTATGVTTYTVNATGVAHDSTNKYIKVTGGNKENFVVNEEGLDDAIKAAKSEVVAGKGGVSVAPVSQNTDGANVYTVNAIDTQINPTGKYTSVAGGEVDANGVRTYTINSTLQGGKDIEIGADGKINYTGTDNDTKTTVTTTDSNLKVTPKIDGENREYDIALNKNLDLSDSGSLKVGDTLVNNAGVSAKTITGDTVNATTLHAGDGNVFNVSGSTATYNTTVSGDNGKEVANVEYVNKVQTVVEQGKNTVVTGNKNSNGGMTYTVDAYDTKVKAGSGLKLTQNGDTADSNNVRTYELALSDENQNAINNAMSSLTTAVDGTTAQTLNNSSNQANFMTGDNIQLSGDANGITIATKKDVQFDSVETGSLKADTANISTGNISTLNAGNNFSVAGDTATYNTTVSGNDGKEVANVAYVQKSLPTVKAGTNIVSVNETSEDGHKVYTVNAVGVVEQAGGNKYVKVSGGGTDDFVIDDSALDTAITSISVKASPVQYSNADDPITPNGGTPSNDVTLIGADNTQPVVIHNVGAGYRPTDAVNVSQLQQVAGDLNNRMDGISQHSDASAASAIAVASMPQAYLPGKNLVSIGGGTYHGQTGYAVGISTISDNGSWIFKATATGNSKNRYGGGYSRSVRR